MRIKKKFNYNLKVVITNIALQPTAVM